MIPGFGVIGWTAMVIDFNLLFFMVLGLRGSLVGFVDDDGQYQGIQVDGYCPVRGSLDSLENILQDQSIVEVIVSRNDIPMEGVSRLAETCKSHRISLRGFQNRLEEVLLPI